LAPRKRFGRAAAEAAYADLMKEATTLIGDVGAHYESYMAKLADAAVQRERYENARAAAIKANAITSDQLDQMSYKKTTKLPVPTTSDKATDPPSKIKSTALDACDSPEPDHVVTLAEPVLASVGGHNERQH
jgi:hypothetical protein